MKKFTSALIAAFFITAVSFAQPITTSIGNLTKCTDDVIVPIQVVKVQGVGAISLTLAYDNSVLTFVGYQNPHPALLYGTQFTVNATGGNIYLSWHSVIPLNILAGTLVEYRFNSVGGNSALNWNTVTQGACEYADINAVVLPSVFLDGSVTVVPDPAIVSNPSNVEIEEVQNASFSVIASNATAYQWEVSTDNGLTWAPVPNALPYSGVNTPTLQIFGVPVYFNQYQYRAVVSGLCTPAATSAAAILTVNPIINTYVGGVTHCADEIVVPINVTHFYGVAGISLTLGFNTVVLNYNGILSSHPNLAGGILIDNSTAGKVYISWYSFTPVDIGDDLLFELSFTANLAASSSLVWDLVNPGANEYNNIQSEIITSIFHNGNVNVLPLPTKYTLTGGGEYCIGTNGVMIGLSGSQNGFTYDLYRDDTMIATYTGTGSALSFGYFTAVGEYTVFATNPTTGCDTWMPGMVTVGVNPVPTVDAGSDVSILLGTSAWLNGNVSGGTPGYTYEWMPGGMATEDVSVSPSATTVYTFKATDVKGCYDMDDVTVTVYTNTISGNVRYHNTAHTALPNVTVYLESTDNGGSKTILTDVTDMNGYYEFPPQVNGDYRIYCTSTSPWGGVNSTDALMTMEHFINYIIITDPLVLKAADVDNSGYVNTTDAFSIASRFAQIITSFARGNWVFEEKMVTLFEDNTVAVDIDGLCTGDVNASFIPYVKTASSLSLLESGQMNVADNKSFIVPLAIDRAMNLGAISLVIDYPSQLNIEKVYVGKQEAIFNALNGKLYVSWYNHEGFNVKKGDVVVRITARGSISDLSFTLSGGSEIADVDASVISGAALYMPKLTSGNAVSDISITNYPNPFATSTKILYELPQAGNVTLSVYNLLGDKVSVLVNGYQDAGSYNVTFDGNGLVPGIYQYRLELNGTSHLVQTKTMVKTK